MRTKTIILSIVAMLALGSTQTSAQLRGGQNNNNVRRETNTKSNNNQRRETNTKSNNNLRRETNAREPRSVTPPRKIPSGYEDRVRYDGKNWCYLRDGHWYSYDHYIEPATYYSRPLAEFGTALVVGTVVGCLISALAK